MCFVTHTSIVCAKNNVAFLAQIVLPEPSGLVIKFRSKCFNQYSNPFEEFKKLILKLSKNDVRLRDYDTSLATIY